MTDCNAFVWTLKKKDVCLRVAHWVLLIEQFDYIIEHRPGTAMHHVDALSRNTVEVLLVQEGRSGLNDRVREAQEEDQEIKKIVEAVRDKKKNNFTLTKNGVLYRETEGGETVVVPKSMQWDIIIKLAHEQGHFSTAKTMIMLKRDYWFPNMEEKVKRVINNCIRCVLAEKKKGKGEGVLYPIEKRAVPLDTYHIDHLGPMPSTKYLITIFL